MNIQVRSALYKAGAYCSSAAAAVGVYRGALYSRIQSTIEALPLFDQILHNWAIPILCGLSVSAAVHLLIGLLVPEKAKVPAVAEQTLNLTVVDILSSKATPGGTVEITKGAILELTEPSKTGEKIVKGQYQFKKRLLGAGGFSEVWEGEKVSGIKGMEIRVPVAIKVLRGADKNFERFAREVRILAGLNHPNIVRYDNVGQLPDGKVYLVMEYIKGPTLGELVNTEVKQKRFIPMPDILSIGIGTSRALMAALANGVIHRDIKPENIIIAEDDTLPTEAKVKVLDFGIADIEGENQLTQPHLLPGTPSYTAPETLRGNRRTFKSDMYSLGMVLYLLITGNMPFGEEQNDFKLWQKQLNEEPPGMESFEEFKKMRPDATPQVYELLKRLIDKDPDKRPADYKSLIKAFEQLKK